MNVVEQKESPEPLADDEIVEEASAAAVLDTADEPREDDALEAAPEVSEDVTEGQEDAIAEEAAEPEAEEEAAEPEAEPEAVVEEEAGEEVAEAGVEAEEEAAEPEAEPEAVVEEEAEEEVAESDVEAQEPTAIPVARQEPDDGTRWYVVHTYSGYERKVQQSLEERVRTLELEDEVTEILIPTEDVVEMKGGKKVVTAKKFFPGYLLIRMAMNDRLWHIVKNTPRVTGFVGSGRQPIPLPQHEVEKIVNRMEESVEAPKPKFHFNTGESVRIIDGPFTNFSGKVDDVDSRRNTLKVMVSIFGRNTPVELDFFQVEKV